MIESGIAEPDVQKAVIGAIKTSVAAQSFLLREVRRLQTNDAVRPVLLDVTRSVFHDGSETDIVADWVFSSERRLRILIEVKLKAAFMPRQGARYRERVESLRLQNGAIDALSLLLAPSAYFRTANPEMRFFDYRVSLEDFIAAASDADKDCLTLVCECLDRLASGKALGGKGIFRGTHDALAHYLASSGSALAISNNSLDWVFLTHPSLPTGVRARYRIEDGHAELRFDRHYRRPHSTLPQSLPANIARLPKNTETVFRITSLRVSAQARQDSPDEADITDIAAALESLISWWSSCENAP